MQTISVLSNEFLFVPEFGGYDLYLSDDGGDTPGPFTKHLKIEIPEEGKGKSKIELKRVLFKWCDCYLDILASQFAEKYNINMDEWLQRTKEREKIK